jgi:hypothetical protein
MRVKLPANTPPGQHPGRSFALLAPNRATSVRTVDHAFDAALPFG